MPHVACPTCAHTFVIDGGKTESIVKCPNCKLTLRASDNLAPPPQERFPKLPSFDQPPHPSPPPRENDLTPERTSPTGNYPAMDLLCGCYRILAGLCAVAAFGGVLTGLKMSDKEAAAGGAVAIGALIWGALTVVTLLAFAEGITLLIDIESALRQIRDRLPAPSGKRSDK